MRGEKCEGATVFYSLNKNKINKNRAISVLFSLKRENTNNGV